MKGYIWSVGKWVIFSPWIRVSRQKESSTKTNKVRKSAEQPTYSGV